MEAATTIPSKRQTAVAEPGDGTAATLDAAGWLSLAAAPIFAIMALLTAALGGDAAGTMCLATNAALPLTGMLPMYILMSAFHAAPWLKIIARCRHGA